ncbi:MAG: ATP-binding protein [Bacteroidetes bacterium]|nr:ATP-binding protein [Bacteroidota bacterium]
MVKDFNPKIGKTVIETLTMGMYEDARFIFREYVQNSADQIDIAVENKILKTKNDGSITITINQKNKMIEIEDNATGIPEADVLKFLGDIANSEKDNKNRKGFRGIGRLGGLGYCDKLTFSTSYAGENSSKTMVLDAKLLKKLLLDRSNTMDAAGVISIITDISTKREAPAKHYFKITMESVSNPILLDIDNIRNYLSQVAPVPFNPTFSFGAAIKKYFTKNNIVFDEYNVSLNTKQVFKLYQNTIIDNEIESKVLGVDYFEVRNHGKELLALGWYGYRDMVNNVLTDAKEKGIRLRKHNIQIGSETTLNKFFKIQRTNQRLIGELYVVGPGFIPNARRDYFNDNKTCQDFERELTATLQKENLENVLAHSASQISNRVAEIQDFQTAKSEYEQKKGSFKSYSEETHVYQELKSKEDKASKASKALTKLKSKALGNKKVKDIYDALTSDKDLKFDPNLKLKISKYDPPRFSKLTPAQSKIVLEIFEMIDEMLQYPKNDALKKKIIDRYN